MKILVVSDTHGRPENYEKVLKKEAPLDMVIHCGDVERDEEYLPIITPCPFYMVAGNNDYASGLQSQLFAYAGNDKILITHGHMYGVNYSLDRLVAVAKVNGATMVCFGHTHVPLVEKMDDITMVNPGSLSLPRQMGRIPTYAIMELKNEKDFSIKICQMDEK